MTDWDYIYMASKEAGNYYPQTDYQPLDWFEKVSLAIACVGGTAVLILAAVLVAQIYQGIAP